MTVYVLRTGVSKADLVTVPPTVQQPVSITNQSVAIQTLGGAPGNTNAYTPPIAQSFQLTVKGTGAVAATAQVVGSNDGVNWTNYGPALTASGTGSSTVTGYGQAPYAYFGALITAISGTSAQAAVTMSA